MPEVNLFGHQLRVEPDGSFELFIGGPERGPNWLPTTADSRKLFIRQIFDTWDEVPDNQVYENGFKLQWEEFIRHVAADTPWRFNLLEGAKGVQLAELGLKSWAERRWLDVPPLSLDVTEGAG